MDCTLDRHLIEAYVDGELGFERSLDVEAHLASCLDCSGEVQTWKDIRAAIQCSDLYYSAPANLERRLRGLLPLERRTEVPSFFHRWIWGVVGSAVATTAWIIVFMTARPVAPSFDNELVTTHIRSLISDHLMDVVSTDQHTVKPWFDGKLDFAPPVQDLKDEGYPLAGGRLDYLNHRIVAVLIYHRALHVINLYIWPAKDKNSSVVDAQSVQGYNELSWKKNGFEFRAVSDLNVAELRDFAGLLMP
jgi:anti-sigma factor RsiW